MSPFAEYCARLDRAVGALGLSRVYQQRLSEPNNIIEKKLDVELSTGLVSIPAYRVQFNNARGPYKGGIRFHPAADLDEVKTLAALMAIKCAVVGIPLGGGKGGAAFDPNGMSMEDILKIARAWARAMAHDIGVDKDIPAPDVNTNGEIMGVMLDEFEKTKGVSEPGVFTGKPIALGGSLGRETATSVGGIITLFTYLKNQGMDPKTLSVAVQGIGNVGGHAARILHEQGVKIVALSDSKNGIYSKNGIDVPAAMVYKEKNRTLQGFPGSTPVTNEALLVCETDVLIPAAIDNQIRKDNADMIMAKIILELANNPTTSEADVILHTKGVVVIPDVLANAGGVTVSYFEWVQNRQQFYWTEKDVAERLEAVMKEAFEEVELLSKKYSVPLRDAAFLLGVSRIAEALTLRGLA